MSRIPDVDPYPSDAFIVDQVHDKPTKDVFEAALEDHDWFGFGTNHDSGSDVAVITRAGEADVSAIAYTSGLPTLVTYEDTSEFTGHTLAVTYTSGLPTQTVEVFVYSGQTWTVTTNYTYNEDNLPDSKDSTVVKS